MQIILMDIVTQNGNFKILEFDERCGNLDLYTAHDLIEGDLVSMICTELKSSADIHAFNSMTAAYIEMSHIGRLIRHISEAPVL